MKEELPTQAPEPEIDIPLEQSFPTTSSTVTSSPVTWNALWPEVEPQPLTNILLIDTSSEVISNPLPLVMLSVVLLVAFPIIVTV